MVKKLTIFAAIKILLIVVQFLCEEAK